VSDREATLFEKVIAAPSVDERLDALREFVKLYRASVTERPPGRVNDPRCPVVDRATGRRRGVNLHLHTNESFSSFRSPTEAIWQAVREGIAVMGINDHYTLAGHDEFRRACELARLPATYSMEAVGMEAEAAAAGRLLNDPGNPGRVYLSAKGITRTPPESSDAMRTLSGMRAALERRNREMTAKAAHVFHERLSADAPSWEDVLSLTPRGNATERHISKAIMLRVKDMAASGAGAGDEHEERKLFERLCGTAPPEDESPAALQNFVRAKLLKVGAPCFVEESADAFVSMARMRDVFLEFGAIPTYPVLGNPVTDGEEDIDKLLDGLIELGWHAIEVIPFRNTRERLAEIVEGARRRWLPVFPGTEHNTPDPKPLLDQFSLDPDFEPAFADGAAVLLGHQAEVAAGRLSLVDKKGRPTIADPRERFEHFRAAGAGVIEKHTAGR
jgi:hypothetical protein